MKWLFFAVLTLAPFAADANWSVLNLVSIQHGSLVIDHSKNVREITAAQAQGGFKADRGVGLFQSRIKVELTSSDWVAGGKRMSLTTHISTQPIIYIAQEIPKGTCSYQLVLNHELMHQELDLQVLRAMPDEIRMMTQDIFADDELERSGARGLERARAHFFQQFNYVYQALGEMRHPLIDSPESYRNLSAMCNGELATLLRTKPRP